MTETLSEIIQAQNKINIKNFSNSINELENSLANNVRINKRSIDLLFLPIDEVFSEFGNKIDYSKYKDLYNNIFLTVCKFEKIFVQQRVNTRNFFIMLKSLSEDFEKKVSKIDNNFKSNSLKDYFQEFETKLHDTLGDDLTLIRSTVDSNLESIRCTVDQAFRKKINNIKRELCNNFYKQIVTKKIIFEKNNKIDLEPHLNYLELNANMSLGKYDKDFKYKIPAVRKRLIPTIEKNVYLEFHKSNPNFVDNLKKILELVCNLCNDLEKEKKKKTQQILKDRRYNWSDAFVWDNDQEYLDYAKYWTNDFIVGEFLGLVGQYVDWKYPIAYIEPNVGELTRHIISGDPFYVIDDRVLPYENLLKTLPNESQRKISRYDKKTATTELENSSVGMCVSWNNYPFMTQGKIAKDIKMVSDLLRPGGLFVCNYADAHSVDGAKFVEKSNVPVFWKERMDQFASENNLVEISSHEFNEYPFKLAVYGKIGKMPELPVTNKIGLVLPNETHLQQLRQEHTEENTKQRALNSKLEQDLKRLQERDKLLKDLDEQRQLGKENLIEAKLQNAINHLNSMLAQYNNDHTHPSVLESILHVSKLTYSLGRTKDSKNIIKRVSRDIEKMSEKNLIARKFREWQDFLNNIDT